ncbi:MAG TPA: heavy metal transporter [Actinobacteria bacterium]|nr:heavy metal transporter [Actinomycetota bacterium]
MTTKVIKVSGMTCGHCVSAVTEELSSIAGVSSVAVELVPGEVSVVTVTSEGELAVEAVAAAIDEAGYDLVE